MVPLRLAIATPRFWPHLGDAPTHLLRLAESLVATGHQVTVVTPQWKRAWPRQITIGAVPVVRLRSAPRGGWSTLRWMYALRNWLREFGGGVDAVLATGLRHEAYVAISYAQSAGIRAVLLAGEEDITWQATASFGKRIGDRCKEAAAIVAPSTVLADKLLAAGYAREKITVIQRRVPIPPPRSPKLRDDARAALATANYDLVTTDSTAVALAVGRLDAEHRFGDLIRAWRIVAARRSNARLWIIGDGPERDNLYRQIGDLDQRFRVLIPGTFDGLDELLQAADISLVPAPHITPPLAMLEAMAAGLPVIAADASELRQSAEACGLSYPAGDIKALAAQVLQLLDNPAMAVSLGAAARAKVQADPKPESEAAEYVRLIARL
jgi:glycosyltransferase involved in cell wall biosynthesis